VSTYSTKVGSVGFVFYAVCNFIVIVNEFNLIIFLHCCFKCHCIDRVIDVIQGRPGGLFQSFRWDVVKIIVIHSSNVVREVHRA